MMKEKERKIWRKATRTIMMKMISKMKRWKTKKKKMKTCVTSKKT